jgi:hypothetical protein
LTAVAGLHQVVGPGLILVVGKNTVQQLAQTGGSALKGAEAPREKVSD